MGRAALLKEKRMQDVMAVRATLERAKIENAAHEARLLCEAFEGEALADAVARRVAREPLQYILGEWGFFRESYEVSPDCLVPRPDTEHLVERAISLLPTGARFLDLCTGSGCVAISTLCARPDTTACAVDLFPNTLSLAARNAEKNGVAERAEFHLADVLETPPSMGQFDAILSNPPYIRTDVIGTLSHEVKCEPHAALDGGADGLVFYRAILDGWRTLLREGGFFLFEIGYDQAAALSEMAGVCGLSFEVFRDYGGNDRVVLIRT